MINIETLSSSGNAAIISIGACAFDVNDERKDIAAPCDVFQASVKPSFYRGHPDYDVSEGTIKWWLSQPKEAQDSLRINQQATLRNALDKFEQWLSGVGFKRSSYRDAGCVWANPPQFDLSILRHAYSVERSSQADAPWHYMQERDVRTLRQVLPRTWEGARFATRDGYLANTRTLAETIRQAREVKYMLENLPCA
jgi:hypothetical protein